MLNMIPFDGFLFGFRLAGPHARQHSTESISEMDHIKSIGRPTIKTTAWQMNPRILVIYVREQVSNAV